MSSLVLNNRIKPISCEVTYDTVDDLIVAAVISEYDETLQDYIELSRGRAIKSGVYTYSYLFTPGLKSQYIVELMVFEDVDLTIRDFNYGISSRAFTVDEFLADQFELIAAQITSLASLLNSSPQVNIIAEITDSVINGVVSPVPIINGIVTDLEILGETL